MKHQLVSTTTLDRLLKEAEEAWNRKDFGTCIATLESASRRAPGNASILLQLGRIQGLRYNYSEAERCFEKAIRISARKTEALAAVANSCMHFRQTQLEERYLKLALGQPDVRPETIVKLAELNERLRQLPQAAELIERALKLSPGHPGALLVRARLERLDGHLEKAEQTIRSFITKPNPDNWVQVQSWYELAGILDRQSRFDEAMAAYLDAKELMRPEAASHLARLKVDRTRLKVMEADITAEMLERWREEGRGFSPPRRLALLCGHPRSGTTLLEQVLDSHPDLVSAEEADVFNEEVFAPLRHRSPPDAYMLPVLESAPRVLLEKLRADYFRAMELCIGKPISSRMLLDKNPALTFMIPGFARVFPETRFLIALRDPRDVFLSCFMQPQPLNPVTAAYLTLEGAVQDYTAVMSLWRTFAPLMSDRYLEVRYENMVENLESVARRTLDFLGLPWDQSVLSFAEHAQKKLVRSPTYADVTKPVYKRAVGRWQNYQKYLEPHLPKLEPFVKAFGYG